MKFLELFISFVTSQGRSFLRSNAQAMSRQMANNVRKLSRLLAIMAISIALFCTGISMAYSDEVAHLERGDGWVFSAALIGGGFLALLSFLGLVYSLGEKRWLELVEAQAEEKPKEEAQPLLQAAIAALLLELAAELKERRSHASKPQDSTSQI